MLEQHRASCMTRVDWAAMAQLRNSEGDLSLADSIEQNRRKEEHSTVFWDSPCGMEDVLVAQQQ